MKQETLANTLLKLATTEQTKTADPTSDPNTMPSSVIDVDER